MKKILLFAGSNSSQSINRSLLEYAAGFLNPDDYTLLDLKAYNLPLYSTEIEHEGIPENARTLSSIIREHEVLIISVAEHNGSITAFLKNVLDWVSRAQKNYRVFDNNSVVLLSTSPGAGGGQTALAHAETIITRLGGTVVGKMSVPAYYQHVEVAAGTVYISNRELVRQFSVLIDKIVSLLEPAHSITEEKALA
ncbi:NADPH-dependent FMN reductase [Flammeovirgaceae bacterium 311]|nr:NADPH-dependent FMN reductase [Flammeovirgaceae bacterium 311]